MALTRLFNLARGWALRLNSVLKVDSWRFLDPGMLLLSLIFGALLLYRLEYPIGGLIFDETYYVQDTRVLLGRPVTSEGLPGAAVLSFGDPNSEHPPLAKLIMMVGMGAFQDHPIGWRLPSVLLGIMAINCAYGIVRALDGSVGQARLTAFLMASDNLFWVHSRIATLDIYLVSFMLLGTWLYLTRRFEMSGIAFAVATLCKINGLLGVAALFLYELGRAFLSERKEPKGWVPFCTTTGFFIAFFYFGLGALDCYWTEFRDPFLHVQHIFKYAASLTRPIGVNPQGAESTPLQWWLNKKAFDYYSMEYSVGEIRTTEIAFRGEMNAYFLAMAPFALVYSLLEARKGDRLSLLICSLFVCNYGAILVTWLKTRRICYLYYMVPSIACLACAVGKALWKLPGWATITMVGASIYSFCSLFPFQK